MFKFEYDLNDAAAEEETAVRFPGQGEEFCSTDAAGKSAGVIDEEWAAGPARPSSSSAMEPFVCHYCDARFRMRGYLTRHIKKHAIEKAFRCPFFQRGQPRDLQCHPSGGFSRRDTYKTHLKVKHVLYPPGVRPSDRNRSGGHCTACGEYTESLHEWVEQHIESGACQGLPADYIRAQRSARSSGRLRVVKTSTGHARFISTVQSVVEPAVLLNKEALEAMAIVAHSTNTANILSQYGRDKIIMAAENYTGEARTPPRATTPPPPPPAAPGLDLSVFDFDHFTAQHDDADPAAPHAGLWQLLGDQRLDDSMPRST
ncbi:Stp1p KNAG_0C06030 [Huiozyma naganishii CBS 8797]|uniref:Transcription factor STP1 n=1 Tax=Huiozyma naganishii (strain ATCC MYA-139 / BCRC 22969 / CBS 8797 / KCTC 17520 / NBRC 10181 / NCYC 3082 / Yp74L-3) TaxID=1071383 RepID=J7R4C3_HUIN7|nr:hypothetical protein KNAG_0C06030 [Kazachstania naganishii CBS 8797]CCK69700.1 hypothetical protein KNAG_0C06030 [Kazachstania naganishii CBS 8797]